VCTPYLVEYYGNGHSQPVSDPLPTQTAKDRFALVVPELFPLGLDIKFRMLKPSELAAAQGFPPSYEFTGNKTETVKQIGNAVPVNLAQSLCEQMLVGEQPTIDSYTGGTGGIEADD
jgi:DNA (cytosine-5)-methyltransferase 1